MNDMEVSELAERARHGRLSAEDVQRIIQLFQDPEFFELRSRTDLVMSLDDAFWIQGKEVEALEPAVERLLTYEPSSFLASQALFSLAHGARCAPKHIDFIEQALRGLFWDEYLEVADVAALVAHYWVEIDPRPSLISILWSLANGNGLATTKKGMVRSAMRSLYPLTDPYRRVSLRERITLRANDAISFEVVEAAVQRQLHQQG